MEEHQEGRPPNGSLLTEVGGLVFSSCFDSGNLAKVQFEANEYRLWIGPDCAGTPHETSYTTWFHFSMQGGKKGQVVSLTIMNSNPLKGLYGSDMRPVYRCSATRNRWERLPSPLKAKIQGEVMRLSFRFRFEDDHDTVFFAFCYPWSYQECQDQLAELDAEYGPPARHPSIYYHRELLTRSVKGRRIDLLTISSRDLMRPERDTALRDPHMFPDRGPSGEGAPFAFQTRKRVVFVSARVHPGETPASFVFNGLLSFLLKEDDPRARQLRRQFVFKLVPMLNPDGVVRGHYRLDTQGLNLNRHYITPSPTEHPSIYAVRSLVLHLHQSTGNLVLYMDLHAHAAKKGCFLYGNQFERHQLDKQVATQLYARLACFHSPFLEYGQCVFTERNMKRKDKRDKDLSKEGAGRVALYRATGLTYFYTLECNYNEGTRITAALRTGAFSTSMKKGTPPSQLDRPPRSSAYTSESWENVGEGLAITLLDMAGTNPVSRPVSSSTPPLLGGAGRVLRRSPFDPACESSGNVDDVYRALREQVLLTGNFDDQPPPPCWASANADWHWDGPSSPPSASPEDDAVSTADRSLPPTAPPSASSSARGAKPSPRAAAATASSAARDKLRREREDMARRTREGRALTIKTPFMSGLPQPQYKLQPSDDLSLRLPLAKGHAPTAIGLATGTAAARQGAFEGKTAAPIQRRQSGPVVPGGFAAAAASLRGRTKSMSSAVRSLRLSTHEEVGLSVISKRTALEVAPLSGPK